MRLNKVSEACMWLPGFAPDDDPIVSLGTIRAPVIAAITPVVPGLHKPAKPLPAVTEPELIKATWPRLTAEAIGPWGGKVTKFENNVAAIKLLRVLETEDREPSEVERLVLQRYTGWGGLPGAFNPDQNDTVWAARSVELKNLLTPEEWESARDSTPNAHYTDLPVVDAMWAALQHFGFTGGRILEPSLGVGNFIGAMPKEIAERSAVTGVELDNLSGRLARKLYGQFGVQVLIQGFEKSKLPEGYFDVAISNVPFGAYKVPDGRHKVYATWNIHNYFFGKGLELVRAGGIVAFITSTSTLDRDHQDQQSAVRRHLNAQAEFLGSIRLPSGAFEQIAETSVTTDIIFLRKRAKKVLEEDAEWIKVGTAPAALRQDSLLYKPMSINSYYASNPEMVVGKLDWVSNGYDRVPGVKYSGNDFEADLLTAIYRLPEGVYKAKVKQQASGAKDPVRISAPEYVKPGAYVIEGDRVMVSEGATLIDVHDDLKPTTRARIAGMVEVRNAARRVLATQVSSDDDAKLKVYQVALNATYDLFVKRHGFISARANTLAFKGDPDLPLLLSLEIYDEETESAAKADLFHKRTVSMPKVPTKAETPEEALAISLQQFGRINLDFIGGLVSLAAKEVAGKLKGDGKIFLNPETDDWEPADEYLSGHVREKLEIARMAGTEFVLNVKALEEVQPVDLKPQEIEARLGAPWIPSDDIKQFIKEVLMLDADSVDFVPENGSWEVKYNGWQADQNTECSSTYGTRRANAMLLVVQALNQQVITVRDRDTRTDKYFVNPQETMAAREKQARLKEKFKDWIWEEESRRERLARKYNDEFNSTRPRVFDGSHLCLPGFTQSITLRKHQLDAIWRIIASGNTLLAHVVGAGKTLTMVCASMELRRLGLSSKPLHVVPNHMLEQYTAEFLRAYPTAHVLMASKEDLAGDKRREFVARIATGDWDAVICTHSSFERIKMSPGFMQDFIEEQLADLESAFMAARHDRSNRIVKDLAKAKKTWAARLDKLANEFKKDDLITFEELGITSLYCDEAHLFKNLFRVSKMARIAGLPSNNSERAFDMFVKTRYIMARYNGQHRGVVFATGTPISNSMGEMFTMQRYLQPKTLQKHLVENFDAWAASFGETVTALEVSPDGGGYRLNSRFARFVNLPELLGLFLQVADVRTKEMLQLPVPEIAGGKAQTISVEASAELKEYVQGLVKRAEKIRNGVVRPNEDNMLAVTNDGRKAALDLRLIDPFALDEPGSKVNACCAKVFDVWQRTAAFRGTQLVFCDLSTPSADGRFSVYNDLRAKWIAMGVPSQEIAFIHEHDTDAAKSKLFKAVREGKVRILLGSTSKMGMGTNVQTKLYALHHLDCPWRPADVEQRDGRIERQGNTNAVIEIYRYVTKGSFDAYSWQTLETKAKFIAQVMTGTLGARSVEDVELAALSYAEVKALASGNPLVMEKAGIDAELAKLSLLKSQWRSTQWEVNSEVAWLPKEIAKLQARITGLERDEAQLAAFNGKPFAITLNGTRVTDQEEAGKRLLNIAINALRESRKSELDQFVGELGGFKIGVYSSPYKEFPNFYIDGSTVQHHAKEWKSAGYIIEALLAAYRAIPARLQDDENLLATRERRLAGLLTQVGKPFEYEDRLNEVLARQQEIDAALGLHQDNAGAADAQECDSAVCA